MLPSPAAPEAADDTYPQEPTGPTTVTVPVTNNDTIPCPGQVVLSVKDAPMYGSVDLKPSGTFTYTPKAPGKPNKDDMFTYQVGEEENIRWQMRMLWCC